MQILDYLVEKAWVTYSFSSSADRKEETNAKSVSKREALEKGQENFKTKRPLILLVEDHQEIQEIYSKFLERLNCECIVASHYREALKHLKDIDLILLDIGLPKVDGITLCTIIRRRLSDKHTPIIALTAYGNFIEQECYAAGFNEIVVQPLSSVDLCQLLCKWLPAYERMFKNPGENHHG